MRHSIHRAIAVSELVVLAGLVGVTVSSGAIWVVPAVITGLAACAVVVGVAVLLRRAASSPPPRPGGLAPAALAVLWTLGLIASVSYLNSLPYNSADIPLAGVGGLLFSLFGLLVSAVWLWVHRDTQRPAR